RGHRPQSPRVLRVGAGVVLQEERVVDQTNCHLARAYFPVAAPEARAARVEASTSSIGPIGLALKTASEMSASLCARSVMAVTPSRTIWRPSAWFASPPGASQ